MKTNLTINGEEEKTPSFTFNRRRLDEILGHYSIIHGRQDLKETRSIEERKYKKKSKIKIKVAGFIIGLTDYKHNQGTIQIFNKSDRETSTYWKEEIVQLLPSADHRQKGKEPA